MKLILFENGFIEVGNKYKYTYSFNENGNAILRAKVTL
jgi:hypothetical protein